MPYPLCQHCHQRPASRSRGLCCQCYDDLAIRDLYPSNTCWKVCPECGGLACPRPGNPSDVCSYCRQHREGPRIKPLPRVSPDLEITDGIDRTLGLAIRQARALLEAPTDEWGYRRWKKRREQRRQQRYARNGTAG